MSVAAVGGRAGGAVAGIAVRARRLTIGRLAATLAQPSGRMFKRILIANRGEIACRIIKTARRLGIATVAVYSDADQRRAACRDGRSGGADRPAAGGRELPLDRGDRRRLPRDRSRRGASRATASSPSGRRFRARSRKAGIVFIGPNPDAIDAMGDKIAAKQAAAKAKVSTVPGYQGEIADEKQAQKVAAEIGYPVMIKAAAGGGGKGLRIAHSQSRGRGRFCARALGGQELVRRRPRVHREIHREPAPHRNPGARRQARQRHPSRRARMLDPAPQPEDRRGGAVAAARRGDAQEDGRAGGRAGQGGRLQLRRHRRVRRRAGQDVLLPGDEHAAAGRASGDGAGHRPRSGRADDPRRRGREACDQAERRQAHGLGDRDPHLCRGSVSQFPAVDRPAHALPAAGGNEQRRRHGSRRHRRDRGRGDFAVLRSDDREARHPCADARSARSRRRPTRSTPS